MIEGRLVAGPAAQPVAHGVPSGSHDRAEANPFYDDAILDAALAHLAVPGDVRVAEAFDDTGGLIARLPVVRSWHHGRFSVPHLANWIYEHCYYGAPLLRAGAEEQGWAALLAQFDADPASGDFLHLGRIDPDGPAARALIALCRQQRRPIIEIDRYERAMLHSDLDAESYWTHNVRAKKRKELRRLQNRLAECGTISQSALVNAADLTGWCDAFLALEQKGWKGEGGTALGSHPADAAFFRAVCAGLFAVGGLDMLRIDCDGNPIAMLVNFVGPTGGYSFKIAIDPDFGRYSPGVLIEINNLDRILGQHVAPWMDSCAVPGHPMIDSLWGERRIIAQYRVALRHTGWRELRGRISRFGIARAERLARGWNKTGAT